MKRHKDKIIISREKACNLGKVKKMMEGE